MADNEIQDNSHNNGRVFFSLMEKVGSEGKYQYLTVVIMCIISYLTGGLMLILPYLFYQDPYVCPSQSSTQCLEFVCTLPLQQRISYIPEPSMNTLGNKFGDYRCSSQKIEIDFVMSLGYFGYVAGSLFSLIVGDLMGRKRLMLLNLMMTLVGLGSTVLSLNLMMAGVGMLFASAGVRNCFNACFYFIAETVNEKKRQKFQVLIQIFFGVGVLLNVAWYYIFGDWQIIFGLFYIFPLIITILFSSFFLQDTPMCLVLRYSVQQAFMSFKFIAKLNNIPTTLSTDDITNLQSSYRFKLQGQFHQKTKSFNFIDLFRFKSLRITTLVLILVHWSIVFEFYAPALMLDQFDLGIFINGLVIGVSQILAYPICYLMITKISRKKTAYGCFFITMMCSVVLFFLWNQGAKSDIVDLKQSIEILAFIFLFRFAITVEFTYFFVYFNELYPTQIRVIGTSSVTLMGGVMMTVVPLAIDLLIEKGIPIMMVFAAMSGLSILISSKLPQTLGVSPQDQIQQLRFNKNKKCHEDSLLSGEQIYRTNFKSVTSSSTCSSPQSTLSRRLLSSSHDGQVQEQ